MKLWFALAVLPVSAHASIDCPDAVNTAVNNAGMTGRAPIASIAPNGQTTQVYQDVNKGIRIEASAAGAEWSWIMVIHGNPDKNAKDPAYHDLQLSFKDCKLSTVVSNSAKSDPVGGVAIEQATAGSQFCRNLNSGLTPQSLDQIYLQFSDGDGNILASKLDDTKAMCKLAGSFLP